MDPDVVQLVLVSTLLPISLATLSAIIINFGPQWVRWLRVQLIKGIMLTLVYLSGVALAAIKNLPLDASSFEALSLARSLEHKRTFWSWFTAVTKSLVVVIVVLALIVSQPVLKQRYVLRHTSSVPERLASMGFTSQAIDQQYSDSYRRYSQTMTELSSDYVGETPLPKIVGAESTPTLVLETSLGKFSLTEILIALKGILGKRDRVVTYRTNLMKSGNALVLDPYSSESKELRAINLGPLADEPSLERLDEAIIAHSRFALMKASPVRYGIMLAWEVNEGDVYAESMLSIVKPPSAHASGWQYPIEDQTALQKVLLAWCYYIAGERHKAKNLIIEAFKYFDALVDGTASRSRGDQDPLVHVLENLGWQYWTSASQHVEADSDSRWMIEQAEHLFELAAELAIEPRYGVEMQALAVALGSTPGSKEARYEEAAALVEEAFCSAIEDRDLLDPSADGRRRALYADHYAIAQCKALAGELDSAELAFNLCIWQKYYSLFSKPLYSCHHVFTVNDLELLERDATKACIYSRLLPKLEGTHEPELDRPIGSVSVLASDEALARLLVRLEDLPEASLFIDCALSQSMAILPVDEQLQALETVIESESLELVDRRLMRLGELRMEGAERDTWRARELERVRAICWFVVGFILVQGPTPTQELGHEAFERCAAQRYYFDDYYHWASRLLASREFAPDAELESGTG